MRVLLSSLALSLLAACASSAPRDVSPGAGDGTDTDTEETEAKTTPPDVVKDDPVKPQDTGVTLFYANDDKTLYELDPTSLNLASMKTIGAFDCVPSQATSMTDIAVAKDGRLFGVSADAIWPLTIQLSTTGGATKVHCETKWPLSADTHFNGLTFAPENTVGTSEVLIGGNSTGELYAIDQTSGKPTPVGTLGKNAKNGLPWGVSGDMVFMANSGSPVGFATARTCPSSGACEAIDTLLEIDVSALKLGSKASVLKAVRGPVQKSASCGNGGDTYGGIFGIVALGANVYGFSRKGDFLTIDNSNGSGCLGWTKSGTTFAGAGITTTASVVAPPPN